MKRLSILILILFSLASLTAQTPNLADLEASLDTFSQEFVNTLPMNSAIGNSWSDPYIGGLPHFGAGATVGMAFVPTAAIQPILDTLQIQLPAEIEPLSSTLGLPIPAYVVDAKIGGLILPFDAGVKVGIVPPDAQFNNGLDVEYKLVGINGRLRVIGEDDSFLEVAVGGAYNYMMGSVTMANVVQSTTIDVPAALTTSGLTQLFIPASDFNFNWKASTIDLTAQAALNMNLAIVGIRPFAGFGAATALAEAGGGVSSSSDITSNLGALSALDKSELTSATGMTLETTGISVLNNLTGWSFRAYAGIGINILMVNVDATAVYNVNNKALGATIGARIQF